MLDHLRNSHSVSLDELDVLVLDEADRLLDLGFEEEVTELVKYCPIARQTMLFSATMTAKVEDLAKLSLKRPIRVRITGADASNSSSGGAGTSSISFAPRLVQEFIKLRSSALPSAPVRPGDSAVDALTVESMLLSLVDRSFGKRVIVFFEMKRNAHRFCALLTLIGIKAVELHGDVTQAQRYMALEKFRRQEADVMVATDVAARGLDIPGVQTVINAEMPRNLSIYVHRVGRTARAGSSGRSITLVSDSRRKMLKEILKLKAASTSNDGNEQEEKQQQQSQQVLSRTIPAAVLSSYKSKISDLEETLLAHMRAEKDRARLDQLQMEAEKAENLLLHEEEINARPARTWHQTEKQKTLVRDAGRELVRKEQEKALLGEDASIEGNTAKKLSAREKAMALALADAYPADSDTKKKSGHSMSRKKRRRLEALKDDDDGEDGGEEGDADAAQRQQAAAQRASALQAAPKRAKLAVRNKGNIAKEKTLGDTAMKKVRRPAAAAAEQEDGVAGSESTPTGTSSLRSQQQQQQQQLRPTAGGGNNKWKVVRPSFAVGGLDRDFEDWGGSSGAGKGGGGGGPGESAGMSKSQIRRAAQDKPFTDFDPTKSLRKGGKLGTKSFKSKSKYKRR